MATGGRSPVVKLGLWVIAAAATSGVGLVLLLLAIRPHTREVLPFGAGVLALGLVVGAVARHRLRRFLAGERAEATGATAGQRAALASVPATFRCGACGAPAALALAEPDHSVCGFCHERTRLPEALSAQLRAAAGAVQRQSEAERHIAGEIAGLAKREQSFSQRVARLGGVLAAIAVAVGVYSFATRTDWGFWHGGLLFGVVSAAVVAVLTLLVGRRIPPRIRALVGRYTALKLKGEAGLRCRVCGGPLPAGEGAVFRCDYCSADNLAGQEALGRLAVAAEHAERSLVALSGRTRRADEVAALAFTAFPVTILVAWFGIGAAAGSGVGVALGDLRIPPDSDARFVIVRVDQGGGVRACAGAPMPDGRVSFGHDKAARVGPELVEGPVGPQWFDGKQAENKRIERVYRELRWPHRHMGDQGAWPLYFPSPLNLGGGLICLDEPPPGDGPALTLP